MEAQWIFFIIFQGHVLSQSDPCMSYLTVNDTSLRTDNILRAASCEFFPKGPAPVWVRFVANDGGAMATNCPGNFACGAEDHIWISDSLPEDGDGIQYIITCVSKGVDAGCCRNKNRVRSKNCKSYYVFELRRPPDCKTRYCFNATALPPLPLTTELLQVTTTTEITSTSSTTLITAMSTTKLTTTPSKTLNSTQASRTKSTTPVLPITSSSPGLTVPHFSSTSSVLTSNSVNMNTSLPLFTMKSNKQKSTSNSASTSNIVLAVSASIGVTVFLGLSVCVVFVLYRLKKRKRKTSPYQLPTKPEDKLVIRVKFNPKTLIHSE